MFSVELYSRVRRACHAGGMSERAAAGHFGIDRKTVSEILKHSVPPGCRREAPPVRPKLDPHVGIIDLSLRRTNPGSRSNDTPRGGYMSACAMNMASPAGSRL